MIELNDKDLAQLQEKGISKTQLQKQLKTFEEGIPSVSLEKAAVVGDGILRLDGEQEETLIKKFEDTAQDLELLKFVPASGAASRMFKACFNFLESFDPGNESLEDYFERTGDQDMRTFVDNLQEFPFYTFIRNRIKGEADSRDEEVHLFVKDMLDPERLNYGFYPKGLLPFHNYGEYLATAFEEHLKEAADYASDGKEAQLHFTISEQHGDMFNAEFNRIKERVAHQTGNSFRVSYSFQSPSTDTIAVNPDNTPFRLEDGSILFRPGGHGALIQNLDKQDADLIFIKNIDNVVVPACADLVGRKKKMLAGLLLDVRNEAFEMARKLEQDDLSVEDRAEIKKFLEDRLNVRFDEEFESSSDADQDSELRKMINRPIRVCGMVKNEGEPGGGPFWIRDKEGKVSLQIVESAQVDLEEAGQKRAFQEATHFNPVDIVCSVKDHNGKSYNLQEFVDDRLAFITGKTKEGKQLKALELPGLWNGGMAFWNTIFVEVPLETFNPVKTVNDLLKPQHQV